MQQEHHSNQNKKNTHEIDYEKLYTQIMEFKQSTDKMFNSSQNFLIDYLNNTFQSQSNEIDILIDHIEKNRLIAEDNIIKYQNYLEHIYHQRINKLASLQETFEKLNQQAKQLNCGKMKYKEINLMKKNEILSIKYQIANLTKKNKELNDENTKLQEEINAIKKENKNSYSTEINLLEQVVSFNKRLYAVANAREIKMKEKNSLENQLKQKQEKQLALIQAQNTQIINEYNTKLQSISNLNQTYQALYNDIHQHTEFYNKVKAYIISHMNNNKSNNGIHNVSSYENPELNNIIKQCMNQTKETLSQMNVKLNIEYNNNNKDTLNDNLVLLSKLKGELNNCDSQIEQNNKCISDGIDSLKKRLKILKENIVSKKCGKYYKKMALNLLKNFYLVAKKQKQFEEEKQRKIKELKEKEALLLKELELQNERERENQRLLEEAQQAKTEMKKTKARNKRINKKQKEISNSNSISNISNDTLSPPNTPPKKNKDNISSSPIHAQSSPLFLNKNKQLESIEKSFAQEQFSIHNFDNLGFFDELSKNMLDHLGQRTMQFGGVKALKKAKMDYKFKY